MNNLPDSLKDGKTLLKRFDHAKDLRNGSWYTHMEECYSYAAPQRETFFDHTPGQKKNTTIFDSTAVLGTQTFASRMQQALVPPWQQWTKLVAGDDVTEEQAEEQVEYNGDQMSLAEAFEKMTDTVFTYIHRSNFDFKVYETFIDFAISTGVLTCDYEAATDELVFNAIPLPQAYLENGPRGRVQTVWRESEIELMLVRQLWPDATLPDKLAEKMKKEPNKKETFIEGFVYEPETDVTHYIVLAKTSKANAEIIFSQADDVSPVIAYRGMVVPGENYGRGPVMQLLPDIKTLNIIKEYEMISGAIAASGAWTGVDDGVFNPYTVQIAPGIVVPVGSNDTRNPTIAPLPFDFNFQFTQIKADELQSVINRTLFANPIGDIDDPTKTATEITLRNQLQLQDQSAFFSRVQVELVEQVIKRVVYVLQREGKLPALKLDGKEVSIKHVSPIAKAMDLEDVQTLMQAVQMASVAGPEVMMQGLKVEDMPGYIADKLGVDPSLKRTEAEREQMKQAAAQMMQQQLGGDGGEEAAIAG